MMILTDKPPNFKNISGLTSAAQQNEECLPRLLEGLLDLLVWELGLAWGTVQESARRVVFGSTPSENKTNTPSSPFLSEKNAERLALALCRMRGAALKLGQMLSIQDESLVPAPILSALDIVRQDADVMPRTQLNNVLVAELGSDWSHNLISFDYEPLAAASIGQVHRAVTKDDLVVAMKIQYPGVDDLVHRASSDLQ